MMKRFFRWKPLKPPALCLTIVMLLSSGSVSSHPEERPTNSFVNPLIRYARFRELNSFKPQVERLLEEHRKKNPAIESIIVYFRSLTDGIWFGIGERSQIWPGSLMKIPVMMAYYKLAETDPSVLEQKIPVPENSIMTRSPLKKGRSYTAGQLIGYMIRQSDNVSVKLLSSHNPKALSRTFYDLGLRRSYDEHTPVFTIKDVARFFRVLYNGSYLNPEMSERALRLLYETEFRDGLVAGLPAKVPCAHKYGIQIVGDFESFELHDCGIVYYPDNPYLLGVSVKLRLPKVGSMRGEPMTDREEEVAAEVIRTVSQLIYTEVHSQYTASNRSYEFED